MSGVIHNNVGWQLEQQCMEQAWMGNVLKKCFPEMASWAIINDLDRQRKNEDICIFTNDGITHPFIVELKFRFIQERIRAFRDMSIELYKAWPNIEGWPLREVTGTSYVVEIIHGPRGTRIDEPPREVRVLPWRELHKFVKGNYLLWLEQGGPRIDKRKDIDDYPFRGAIKVRYRIPLAELQMGVPGMKIYEGGW